MVMKGGRGGARKERSDKKHRVNPALPQNVHEKLDRLATAIGITKTSLAGELIELCLNNSGVIDFIQSKYKDSSRFRIIPSNVNGEIKFIFAEKQTK